MTANEPLRDTAFAASYLNLHEKTVQRLARAGEIRSARIGNSYRFRQSWLDEYVESHIVVSKR